MASVSFQTNTLSFRQLFGNGTTYVIPPFQRDYSWSVDEWDDLWLDLTTALKDGSDASHYMGYLVLRELSAKEFEVIDGQQRMTTITLIVLAALKHLRDMSESEGADGPSARRAESLRQSFVGYVDPVSLLATSKLKLNRNNDRFFQDWLVALRHPLPQRKLTVSEKRLKEAFLYFVRSISSIIKDEADPGAAIARLVDQASQVLIFTVITVTNELNAYTVFETLNARGVRLSSTDLLKNYLFSVLHQGAAGEPEIRRLEERWERILGDLEKESFPVFVRAHWMSRHKLVRESELFKTIRAQVSNRAAAFALLEGIEHDIEIYLSLSKPETSSWVSADKKAAGLLRLFNVRQPFPLLMAAKRRLEAEAFTTFLEAMVTLSFRFSVIANGQSSDLETAFNAETMRIESGETRTARDALRNLRGVYVQDTSFKAQFADSEFDTTRTAKRKLVRYILGEFERQAGGAPIDIEDESITIEHICPIHPEAGWDDFTEKDVEMLAPRLGNLTLMPKASNQRLGNAAYREKLNEYRNSPFAITRSIADRYPDWTPATLESRQNELAKQASAIWRISQLDRDD